MYRYEDIRVVHLEITERCQAGCPLCPRHVSGKINPHLTMAELSFEDCKKIFKPEFIEQLYGMYMCGSFGDPAIAQDTLEIFKYFKKYNPKMALAMYTNGGVRTSEWWSELAEIFKPQGQVIFSVDGLKDTNHLYRLNVKWDNIENNMRAYLGAGGKARWDYIVFEHNEHQIEEARAFAKELGFEEFELKKSDRFYNYKLHVQVSKIQVPRALQEIKIPIDKKYHNDSFTKTDHVTTQYGSMENYYDKTKIKCKALIEKSLYISAEGLLMPCCWTAGNMYMGTDLKEKQIWNFVDGSGGKDGINVINNSLKDVMNNNSFLSDIKNSWSCSSMAEGKLDICTHICGTEIDAFRDQLIENKRRRFAANATRLEEPWTNLGPDNV